MSVYSYIEVVEQEYKDRTDNNDKDLNLGSKRGFSWEYQIAVSEGSYLYQPAGISNDPALEQLAESYAKLIFEQRIEFSLRNYHKAIKACEAVLVLDIPELNRSIKEDLNCLLEAQEWFTTAYKKLPSGLVRLDWAEYIWGWNELALYELSKVPNQQLQFFREMAVDTRRFTNEQLTEKILVKKYKRNNDLNT